MSVTASRIADRGPREAALYSWPQLWRLSAWQQASRPHSPPTGLFPGTRVPRCEPGGPSRRALRSSDDTEIIEHSHELPALSGTDRALPPFVGASGAISDDETTGDDE